MRPARQFDVPGSKFKVQSSGNYETKPMRGEIAPNRQKHLTPRGLRQNYETKPIDSPAHFTPGGLKSALQ